MSQAEEMLNSIDEATTAARLANSAEEPHIVIGNDRFITVPDELKRLAVQYDHNIETVTFDCPRYWDEHDMSTMSVYINYLCADQESGMYQADNVRVDESDASTMHFEWTITKNVTAAAGSIVFLICIKKADENGNEQNHWNSELCNDCYISKGMEYDEGVIQEIFPDFIAQWEREVLDVRDELIHMRDNGEFDGATFIPSVSEDCDLSWTNDKGKENPATVNIRGLQGVSPTIEVTDIQGGHRVTITDVNGSKSIDVMDTIIETSDAVAEMLDRYTYIGSDEPTITPTLWYDTSIGDYAFYEDTDLALTSLPDGIMGGIGDYAFYGCTNLALTSLPDGITSIGRSAFWYCINLALKSLPDGVTTIGSQAFQNCTSLTTLTFEGTPTAIDSEAFLDCTNLTTINVPWAEGAVANAPWGATNATINYNYVP